METVETLSRDLAFYWEAVDLAEYSSYTTRVGCIAAKGSKKIAGGFNRLRNPAKNVSFGDATFHAEYNVLRLVGYPDKVTLYIARLGKNNKTMPSRPCNRCMEMINDNGIAEIVYMNQFGSIVKEKVR